MATQTKEKQPWEMTREEFYKQSKGIGERELNYRRDWEKKSAGASFSFTPFDVNGIKYIAVETKRGGWKSGYEYKILDPSGNVVLGFHNKNTGVNTALNLDVKNRKELIYKFTIRAQDEDNVIRDTRYLEVKHAFSEGKPVPPEVLKDYPDLKNVTPSGRTPSISRKVGRISPKTPKLR